MIYQFLTDEDIQQQLKKDLLLDVLPDEKERLRKIKKAEGAAIKQVKAKSGKWYNTAALFINIEQWKPDKLYPEGAHIYDVDTIYVCMVENSNATPAENPDIWHESDPRHELLVMYVTDMLIYHLHSSVNPRKIPELRRDRYKEAIGWLEMIADHTENPDFPTLEDEEDDDGIIWGGNPQYDHYL